MTGKKRRKEEDEPKQRKNCPRCKGRGNIIKGRVLKKGGMEKIFDKCDLCNGSGKAKR